MVEMLQHRPRDALVAYEPQERGSKWWYRREMSVTNSLRRTVILMRAKNDGHSKAAIAARQALVRMNR